MESLENWQLSYFEILSWIVLGQEICMIDEPKDFDGCDTFAVEMKISTNAIFR